MLLLSSFLFMIGIIFLTIINGVNEFRFTGFEFINSALLLLITFLLIQFIVIIIHEYLHGIGFKLFKGKPIFGFMVLHRILPVAYTHVKGSFTKKQFNFILLLPLIMITAVGLSLSVFTYLFHFEVLFYILFFSTIINLAGCSGDLYTVFLLYPYPSYVIVDNRELTDPLFILSVEDFIKDHSKFGSILILKGLMVWFILSFILEITFTVTATFLLMFLGPILHLLNIGTLDLFFWQVIESPTGFGVQTGNPLAILFLSMIVSLLICFKYRNSFKPNDDEKQNAAVKKKPKTPFVT